MCLEVTNFKDVEKLVDKYKLNEESLLELKWFESQLNRVTKIEINSPDTMTSPGAFERVSLGNGFEEHLKKALSEYKAGLLEENETIETLFMGKLELK